MDLETLSVVVNAFSLVVLVLITGWYAWEARGQRKAAEKAAAFAQHAIEIANARDVRAYEVQLSCVTAGLTEAFRVVMDWQKAAKRGAVPDGVVTNPPPDLRAASAAAATISGYVVVAVDAVDRRLQAIHRTHARIGDLSELDAQIELAMRDVVEAQKKLVEAHQAITGPASKTADEDASGAESHEGAT
ncbi:MAG: hypothetical protein ACYC7A_14860 [Thermoanaerobaculia bacterium]